MNPLIVVIADDLTGVCDTGAQFASSGLRTIGSVEKEFNSKDIPEVLIVNTQSRGMDEPEAYHSVRRAVAGLKRFKPKWYFKKIDTALRGNIATEVYSMMEGLGVHFALYVAAIPGAGRTTVKGCQLFHGIPIKDSIHGEDRFNPNPIRTSSNVELFLKIPGLEIEKVDLDEVRSGKLNISGHLEASSRKIIIFDSETDRDIDQIVLSSMKIEPGSFFFIGSFGLSSALGRYLADSSRIAKKQEVMMNKPSSFKNGRILVACGSSHPMARSQLSFLEERGMAEIMQLTPEDLMDHFDSCVQEVSRVSRNLWDQHKGVVIAIGEGKSVIDRQSQSLVIALARVVRQILSSNKVDGLVLVGGETGYAVCRSLGIERIEISGNISFVAAYGKPVGNLMDIEILVTKGGSLGEENTLEKVLNFLGLF